VRRLHEPARQIRADRQQRQADRIEARADARLPTPKRLCPQPCPGAPGSSTARAGSAFCERRGSASYSPMMPMTGRPLPNSATNAVRPCHRRVASLSRKSATFITSHGEGVTVSKFESDIARNDFIAWCRQLMNAVRFCVSLRFRYPGIDTLKVE
jgi:hypothetical protein